MNSIRIDVKFGESPDYPTPQLTAEIVIDDCISVPWTDSPVDMLALCASTGKPGWYFIWTCTCGIPECAGIGAGVQVSHTPTSVSWHSDDPPFDAPWHFEFAKAAYDAEIARAWAEYGRTYREYRAAGIHFEPCPDLPEATIQAAIDNGRGPA